MRQRFRKNFRYDNNYFFLRMPIKLFSVVVLWGLGCLGLMNTFAETTVTLGAEEVPLQRLFTSVADREALERIKAIASQERHQGLIESGPPDLDAQQNELASHVAIHGIVMRERAPPVLWINQSNTLVNSNRWQDLSIRFPSGQEAPYPIQLITEEAPVTIMPGQFWLRDENSVSEQYLQTIAETSIGEVQEDPLAQESSISELDNMIKAFSPESRIDQAERILRQ
jgi:hypothetical protein